MTGAPIGVFDSGVGGLSVLRVIRRVLPCENLLYVSDSGFAPYGVRSAEFITQRAERMVEFLVSARAKAVVVACNTASAAASTALRSRFVLPIIAIEPAIKSAVAITKSRVIGVLATHQTLAGAPFLNLVEKYGEGVRILLQSCGGLVEQVEIGELRSQRTKSLVVRSLSPLLSEGADTIVLGCTHLPFLTSTIKTVAGPKVALIDPSVAVVRELQRRLRDSHLLSRRSVPGGEQFWTTGVLHRVQPVVAKLLGRDVPVASFPDAPEVL